MNKENYIKTTVLVVTHYENKGSLEPLKAYLLNKSYSVTEIFHPLKNYSKNPTMVINGKKIKSYKRYNLSFINWIIDTVFTTYVLATRDVDVYISVSNLDTLPAIFLRKIFRKNIGKIIYYPRDYSGKRFNNKVLNKIYIYVESLSVRYSDSTVSNTRRSESKRFELGLKAQNSIVIPNGVTIEKVYFKNKIIDKNSYIYVGDVSKEHGLYEFIRCFANNINRLVIIGFGDDWQRTLDLCETMHINIESHYKKSYAFVLNYLKSFTGFGLAPYNRTSEWTYYCSPLKVAEYIVMSVPVIMSSVPEISNIVKKDNLGITYSQLSYTKILRQVEKFDTTDFYKRAMKFYQEYNYVQLLKEFPI